MKKPTTPDKRQQFFNWNGVFFGILILLLLNTLLAPYIGSSEIKDADYGTVIPFLIVRQRKARNLPKRQRQAILS